MAEGMVCQPVRIHAILTLGEPFICSSDKDGNLM